MISQFIDDYRFLSNFYTATVILPAEPAFNLPAMVFKTLENAYVASKTTCIKTRRKLQTMHPGKAKRYAYKKSFPLRDLFLDKSIEGIKLKDRYRLMVMIALTDSKYSYLNPNLVTKLLATNDLILVEGNYHNDTFFGFCLKKNFGHNYLGQLITQRRTYLQHDGFSGNYAMQETLMKIYS